MIIGLHGAKGSGRDQFFNILKDHIPNVKKVAYADPIKQVLCDIFALNSDNDDEYDLFKRTVVHYTLDKQNSPTWAISGRDIVKGIGLLMRSYDERQFVDYVEYNINEDPNAIWCITDVRFDNEVRSVLASGGFLVKIKRPGVEYDGHITETEIPDNKVDYVVVNSGTLDDYKRAVLNTFELIRRNVR